MTKTWASKVRQELIEAGFDIIKREEDGWWELQMGGLRQDESRSLGDLLRKSGNALGVAL